MKTILSTLLVSAVVVLVAGLGFVYSGIYDVSAKDPHWPISNWLMNTTMHASVERHATEVVVPEFSDDMKRAGANDFEAMCVSCHGSPAQKPGAIGQGLNPPAAKLTHSAEHLSAAELYWITKNGIKMTGMPAWGASHGDKELWPVVAFMTTLPALDEASYRAYLESASGAGHHGTHHELPATKPAQVDAGNEAKEESQEHDHSSHEH